MREQLVEKVLNAILKSCEYVISFVGGEKLLIHAIDSSGLMYKVIDFSKRLLRALEVFTTD